MIKTLALILCISFSAGPLMYLNTGQPVKTESTMEESPVGFEDKALMDKIYESPEGLLSIYSSELMDTYLVAAALYFDFESQSIMPNPENRALYSEVVQYFSPYKDHVFIQGLGKYVDENNGEINHSVTQPLLLYALSKTGYDMEVNQIQTMVFSNGEEFNGFVDELYEFYQDTQAGVFFKNTGYYDTMKLYFNQYLDTAQPDNLIRAMEDYVGNKDRYFKGLNTAYMAVMSVFRPNMASFYTLDFGVDLYFTGFMSPNGTARNPAVYDYEHALATLVHEYLHCYINDGVEERQEKIEAGLKGKTVTDYTSSLYQNMPWYRIVDENIVRVVTASVFAEVYGNPEEAYEKILALDVQYGFNRLDPLFHALRDYEQNRALYPTIDDYLDILIDIFILEEKEDVLAAK